MLSFAPQYCDYLLTSSKPSLLVKLLGVYTVKIKDTKTGEVKQKLDLVVMEHLFYEQDVSRKFDLKGITSRVTKTKEDGQTLWDADWEQSYQNRLLIHPHHKMVLREAIAADTEFLAKNNVMDYSCLVGVDDKEKTLTAGLIDCIGTYSLAKLVESNSKRVLQGERTVIPPDEYAARFRKALEGNFVASPEKWSKSPGARPDDVPPPLSCPL
jgi:1-phosphatidylinositol-3-phosphate 5-kinase